MKPKIPAMLEGNPAPKTGTNNQIAPRGGLPAEGVPFTLVASRALCGNVGKSVGATELLAANTDC